MPLLSGWLYSFEMLSTYQHWYDTRAFWVWSYFFSIELFVLVMNTYTDTPKTMHLRPNIAFIGTFNTYFDVLKLFLKYWQTLPGVKKGWTGCSVSDTVNTQTGVKYNVQ